MDRLGLPVKALTLTRLLALADATDAEADRLLAVPGPVIPDQDTMYRRDLVNFRTGQAVGLRQAVEMLVAEYPFVLAASSN